MFGKIKKLLYFSVANYFRLFAQIQLFLWKPRIIVVTGSSGKTTLLHFIQSQLKEQARYSHNANSTYGIPFDILGLKRANLILSEWPYLFLAAPFKALKKPYKEKFYIVEADCDRPKEGEFLASLLKPEVTLWTSSSQTHSMNFETLAKNGRFPNAEEAIANEYGNFLKYTSNLVVANGDSKLISEQLNKSKVPVKTIRKKDHLNSYKITNNNSEFKIKGQLYTINALLPEENFYSIAMTNTLLDYLKIDADPSFSEFQLPPGRSSMFPGIKNTTIIDSSYNATPDGMGAILNMFSFYPAKKKWAVLGDMLEQGSKEQEEHEKLAPLIASLKLSKIILMGPRVSKHTYPKLKALIGESTQVEKFITPKETLDYIVSHIQGEETILFKGARFLEGIIEHLLLEKSDLNKLCRREKIWEIRREKWAL